MSVFIPCDFEIQVLKGLRDGGVQWGAATMAALEALKGAGLVRVTHDSLATRYELSDAGREWLEDYEPKRAPDDVGVKGWDY